MVSDQHTVSGEVGEAPGKTLRRDGAHNEASMRMVVRHMEAMKVMKSMAGSEKQQEHRTAGQLDGKSTGKRASRTAGRQNSKSVGKQQQNSRTAWYQDTGTLGCAEPIDS